MEEEAVDFARRHPDVVVYVRPCECPAPVLQAEYRECGEGGGGNGGPRCGDAAATRSVRLTPQ